MGLEKGVAQHTPPPSVSLTVVLAGSLSASGLNLGQVHFQLCPLTRCLGLLSLFEVYCWRLQETTRFSCCFCCSPLWHQAWWLIQGRSVPISSLDHGDWAIGVPLFGSDWLDPTYEWHHSTSSCFWICCQISDLKTTLLVCLPLWFSFPRAEIVSEIRGIDSKISTKLLLLSRSSHWFSKRTSEWNWC